MGKLSRSYRTLMLIHYDLTVCCNGWLWECVYDCSHSVALGKRRGLIKDNPENHAWSYEYYDYLVPEHLDHLQPSSINISVFFGCFEQRWQSTTTECVHLYNLSLVCVVNLTLTHYVLSVSNARFTPQQCCQEWPWMIVHTSMQTWRRANRIGNKVWPSETRLSATCSH